MEVTIKFYLYQLLAIGIIWAGMTFFIDEMTESAKIIYYAVTIWLIFLVLFTIRKWFIDRKTKENNQ